MKFKHVATFMTSEGAEHYKKLNELIGYEVRVLKRQHGTSTPEWIVYQRPKED